MLTSIMYQMNTLEIGGSNRKHKHNHASLHWLPIEVLHNLNSKGHVYNVQRASLCDVALQVKLKC